MIRAHTNRRVSSSEPAATPPCLKRGNLRFFLGGSGGSTATRVMLETAVAEKEGGADIVVGFVNSSGLDRIDRLLRCFDSLPSLECATGQYGGANPIDLNAVRKRIPEILLVEVRPPSKRDAAATLSARPDDPLAAIENIVASGIDVWAAVDATGFSSWALVGVGIPRRVSGVSLL